MKLGNHIVMPNHVHGIVIIDKPDGERIVGMQNVGTQNFASLFIDFDESELATADNHEGIALLRQILKLKY